jgi:hypothetical protein
MAKKAKGKLPSNRWLMKNGRMELIKCMRKHPELFAHIEQEEEPIEKGKK